MKRRVVVTGMGAVCPLGLTVGEFWENASAGRSGVTTIDRFDTSDLPVKEAAMVRGFTNDLVIAAGARRKELSKMNSAVRFALVAANQALTDAGFNTPDERQPIGAFIGTGHIPIGLQELQELIEAGGSADIKGLCETLKGQHNLRILYDLPAAPVSWLSQILGLRGFTSANSTTCAAGTQTIGLAMRAIQYGDADVMLAGAAEHEVTPVMLIRYHRLGPISSNPHGFSPEKIARPFDAKRSGFVLAEGSAMLVLEELEHAQARNARIYAELLGFGAAADAYRLVELPEDGRGLKSALLKALQDADVAPQRIQYVSAHGTGTKDNDPIESRVLREVFQGAVGLMVSSLKSQLGHMISAAGAMETLATVCMIDRNQILPTINLTDKQDGMDLDYVPLTARHYNLNLAVKVSAGFGGHNAALVLGAPPH